MLSLFYLSLINRHPPNLLRSSNWIGCKDSVAKKLYLSILKVHASFKWLSALSRLRGVSFLHLKTID